MSRGKRGKVRSKNSQSLARRRPTRTPKTRILIVCEGAETEPRYFKHFRTERRLSKELFCIIGGDQCGAHPKSIVDYAKKLMREARQDKFAFDHVWCVFDRDQHENIGRAFDQAKANRFKLAFSNPCFELWYLLHFQDQSAHIERDEIRSRLRHYICDYVKSADVYDTLRDHQAKAIKRAKDLRKQHAGDEAIPPNPSTTVDKLVQFLNELDTGKLPTQSC
ncbi:MAG: RloB domain-containing protein [Phycisphaerae bacterium]|nr:RloB domain-containing protein [Phycisphaerae bacterium]